MVLVHLVIISLLVSTIESARILGVASTPSYSHQVVFRPIWNELSKKGHDVVVITTDPQNDQKLNITEIDISFAYDLWEENHIIKIVNDYKFNLFKLVELITEILTNLTVQEILHPGVQGLLKNESEHFDLVIVEYMIPAMFGFSERFKCPYIGIASLELPNEYHSLLGNPGHPVLYPDAMDSGSIGKRNFWQRLGSVSLRVIMKLVNPFPGSFDRPPVREFLKEHFGKDLPFIDDLMKKVSLVLINDNPTYNVRPVGPAFVLFGGGTHLMPVKPLPKVKVSN